MMQSHQQHSPDQPSQASSQASPPMMHPASDLDFMHYNQPVPKRAPAQTLSGKDTEQLCWESCHTDHDDHL